MIVKACSSLLLPPNSPPPSLRPYLPSSDLNQVTALCTKNYNGADYIPRLLPGYTRDPTCHPYVATIASTNKIIAFCNLRALRSHPFSSSPIFLLEALRVEEALRGKGLGRFFVNHTLNSATSFPPQLPQPHPPGVDHPLNQPSQVRFLSTTIQDNVAMLKVFQRTGWERRGTMHLWPSNSVVNRLGKSHGDLKGRLLHLLDVVEHIPDYARQTLSKWERISSSEEILQTLLRIRQFGGSYLLPKHYSVESAADASHYLESTYAQREGKEVWKLERGDGKAPVLLFMQVDNVNPSSQTPKEFLSACVVDVEGAECCVAFAGERKELGGFRMAFDMGLTGEEIAKSGILGRVERAEYIVFETRRVTGEGP